VAGDVGWRRMKQILLILAVVAVVGCGTTSSVIPNSHGAKAAIEGAIRKAAGKPEGELRREDLEKITKLNIDGQQISDISRLKDLKQLQVLNLDRNRIRNLSPLKDLKQLWSLVAGTNQIRDVSALKGMKKLRELKLHGNQIRDLTPLKDLTLLENLWLENNNVSDLSPLYGLKNLRGLYIQNNPDLTKADIEKLRKALPGLITVINTTSR
jgi:Leucine-rich repeat (LRR) protein